MAEPKRKAAGEPELIQTASRAIVHLRAQNRKQRLGLMFGSGASKDLGFPDWKQLIAAIAIHPEVEAERLLAQIKAESGSPERSLAGLTHIMFEHFRSRKVRDLGVSGSIPALDEQRIKSDWLRIIHEELYRGSDSDSRTQRMRDHPYLSAFADIIKKSPLTVNYNFDDALEKLLRDARDEDERSTTRGYESADKPNAQFLHDTGVIYHPNGFLPAAFEDGASAEVVFSNDAFQDQLISAAGGKYVHLSNHLFRNTCLLIGLSLDDTTLQSMLRQNAVKNPGHIHYIVHFVKSHAELSAASREAIFAANYSSYNLYTLFLTAEGISELASLIRMHEDDFNRRFPLKKRKYVYYVIGSIGAGKSTAAGNFRNLITYDEWTDERPVELARPQSEFDEETATKLDAWIAEQFGKKNYALHKCKEGIHLVDRCPLDPLTFPGDRQRKAENLLEAIVGEAGDHKVEQGHVILLESSIDELKLRNSLKHKYWSDAKLQELLADIENVYETVEKTRICTRGRTAAEVAREIAKVIFLEDYRPVDIEETLNSFAKATA